MNTNNAFKVDFYINYAGRCEEAFKFYEEYLEAKITNMMFHDPVPPNFPKEWPRPVLHSVLEIGGNVLRGSDIAQAEPMRSAYLTLITNTPERADEIYEVLSKDGEVYMKIEKNTFFANRFAMFRDKFGTAWMLINEKE